MESLYSLSDYPLPHWSNWGDKIADFEFLPYVSFITSFTAITEFNFKKLLRQLPNGSDFRIGGNGRIIHKNDQPDSQTLHRGLHGELQGAQGQSPNIARLPTPLSMMSDDFQEEASTYTTQRRFSPGTTE